MIFPFPLTQKVWIDPIHQSHNASEKYPRMHHFVTEMCTYVHISVTKWYILGYGSIALCDLWIMSVLIPVTLGSWNLSSGSYCWQVLRQWLVAKTMTSHSLNQSWPDSVSSISVMPWPSIVKFRRIHGLPFNSLAPGKFEWMFRWVMFKVILLMDGWGIYCKIALRWMSLGLTVDKSKLVQVMAWCCQAVSHYLSGLVQEMGLCKKDIIPVR